MEDSGAKVRGKYLLHGEAGVLIPVFVQIFLESVREARLQKRRNRVDDGLEPGSLLAELLQGIVQLVAFRILDQMTHVRSVHRPARYNISNFESRAEDG
jgi:hypothetical protein